jgi:AcrR family transcriptional regulator
MYTKSIATIANILSSAEASFLRKNYADVTVEDIAEGAGVTRGAAYHHFANKESLYVAMMLSALQEKQALFQTAVDSPGTCQKRLRRLTQIFLELPHEKRDIIKLVRRDINIFKDPVRNQLVRAYQSTLPEQIESILRDGIRDEELAPADARLLSWMYAAIVEVMLTPYAERVFDDRNAMLDFVIRLFFDGAGATKTGSPAFDGIEPRRRKRREDH